MSYQNSPTPTSSPDAGTIFGCLFALFLLHLSGVLLRASSWLTSLALRVTGSTRGSVTRRGSRDSLAPVTAGPDGTLRYSAQEILDKSSTQS